MRGIALFVLGLLFLSASGAGQSTSSESDGMQALVAEVRLLRKDLQTTNGYALKAQILLYRMQIQEAAVGRVTQHLNDLRSSLTTIQDRERNLTAAIKHFEKTVNDSETSPAQKKEAEGEMSGIKAELESVTAEEQQNQTAKMEAEEQLRTEQAKLSALEDQLDRLEKDLDKPH
jgi:DNA repair exonuclease SbcCD ATPase subunit